MGTAPLQQLAPAPGVDVRSAGDEQLVSLTQAFAHQPARDELLGRTSLFRMKLIGRLARDAGLGESDRMDAQQDAVLWTLEAIHKYRGELAAPNGCPFRAFLHHVILCRFIDGVRRRGRYRRHFGQLAAPPPDRDADGETPPGAAGGVADEAAAEPWREVAEAEQVDRLRRSVSGCPDTTRRLFELLAEGKSLKQTSEALDITYDFAKRVRRKLLTRLRLVLN